MEIRINNYPIEIVLENEKTVKDVIASITGWINQKNLIFAGIDIDGQEYHIDDAPDLLIENISSINCIVQSRADIVYETVNEGIFYCDRVIDFLQHLEEEPMDTDELDDLVSGVEWLQEVFPTISNMLGMNLDDIKYRDETVGHYVKELDKLRHRVVKFIAEMKDDGEIDIEDSLFINLKEIFHIFLVSEEMKRLIIESIDSPDVLINSLKEIKENLPGQKAILEKAAVSYQTGNDSQGMEQLFNFIDFMFNYTRTCYQISPVFDIALKDIVIGDESLEEKNRELQILLNETVDIMENNDMISLADILEYEIAESMENLEQYIDLLLAKIVQ
ncbi:MAG: hypothetical protein CVV49_19130 [Spirochaetae bacterium HGW-Spirochaetae-5]|nr:MAG: hypothetical protein CVV49_19130 [Spirochaetae bacterium HGW-Spirochaetae-5]